MQGFLNQNSRSRKNFDLGLNAGGTAKKIAESINTNGSAGWRAAGDNQIVTGRLCNLIVM
eukprot:2830292-Amphidinium_carterae.1